MLNLSARLNPRALGLAAVLALAGCGTQTPNTSGGEVVRFLTTSLPAAATGEAYSQDIQLTSGSRPYSIRLTKGGLPPGLTLSGGRVTGTPTEAKTATFTLEASDANLSIVSKEYTLIVQPTPPTSLAWVAPPTEVKGEVKVPFTVTSGKNVRAVRASIPMPQGVEFVRLEPGVGKPLLLTSLKDGVLRVDAAIVEPYGSNKPFTLFTAVFRSEASVKFEGRVGYDLRAGSKSLGQADLQRPAPAPAAQPAATPGSPAATPATIPAAIPAVAPVAPATTPTTDGGSK